MRLCLVPKLDIENVYKFPIFNKSLISQRLPLLKNDSFDPDKPTVVFIRGGVVSIVRQNLGRLSPRNPPGSIEQI